MEILVIVMAIFIVLMAREIMRLKSVIRAKDARIVEIEGLAEFNYVAWAKTNARLLKYKHKLSQIQEILR